MHIQDNLQNLLKIIKPEFTKLIAVSKTHPPERLMEAYQFGWRRFGENKVQEMVDKYEKLPKDIEWHLIGHLQTNKVKYIASFVHLIHSVDRTKLLEEINKQAQKQGRVIPCLLQIHIADEESKFGFSYPEVRELLQSSLLSSLAHVQIRGLMGMATFTDDEDKVRSEFRGLRAFFDEMKTHSLPDQVSLQELSMGMSNDYEIALEEGSTMIRIGTAIFGSRGQ
ncbi:MAG: YggS family pyridoxal phosphate-dependent enzyme [Bacteroidia bacterium]|nr:YggS family pyridoxal phosphate-dependent enzyme [Bacteroidia bacterium]